MATESRPTEPVALHDLQEIEDHKGGESTDAEDADRHERVGGGGRDPVQSCQGGQAMKTIWRRWGATYGWELGEPWHLLEWGEGKSDSGVEQ